MSQKHDALNTFCQRTQKLCPWPWYAQAIDHVEQEMAQDGGHDWSHLTRVLQSAHALTEATDQPVDWQVVACAVLFHDVVNLPKDHPERHLASTMAAQHAVDYAQEHWSMTEQQLTLLEEAIRCHSFSSGFRATSIEAQLVSDADRLDALGAFGIARTFAVGGMLDRPLTHPSDPLAKNREPNDKVWSVDHFFVKLFKLPDLMYTDAGRDEGLRRVAFMKTFLNVLESELLGTSTL